MNGLLDPAYWSAVNERLTGLLGPQMERLNEVGGLLAGTVTPNQFAAMRAYQLQQSMTPEEMLNNFAGGGIIGTAKKMTPKLHAGTGLPLNADGTVTVYHATTKRAAEAIKKERLLKSAGEHSVYVSSSPEVAGSYGDGTIVTLQVNPSLLKLDDEFPSGRRDYAIRINRAIGGVKIKP